MINREQNTVILLEDRTPEMNFEELSFIKKCITDMGYFVKSLRISEWLNMIASGQSFPNFYSDVMIVPNCRNLPLETKEVLKYYNENHGSLIFIGGPLYYNHVEFKDGKFITHDSPNNTLDANFASERPYVRSGVAPLYKVYPTKNVKSLKTRVDQNIFNGSLELSETIDAIIPCQTNHGWGYDTGANCRFISLVDCIKNCDSNNLIELGQDNGNSGSFAFIELENTKGIGYEGKVNYGMVESVQIGSAVAHIGYSDGIHNIVGADNLLKSLISQLKKGIYLFEAGCKGIRFRRNDEVVFGAKIMNTTNVFKNVNIKFEIQIGENKYCKDYKKQISPKSISDISFTKTFEEFVSNGLKYNEDYTIDVTLCENENIIDKIESVYSFESIINVTDKSEFVSADKDKFVYRGKPWYLAGINYWPLNNQSKEKADYWYGFCDSSNYNPVIIEKDLTFMEKLGLNCIVFRIDFSDLENSIHGLRDLIIRACRHNIKIGISMPKAIASRYYNEQAVEYLFSKVNITNNPTIAYIDVEWESANDGFGNDITKVSWEYNDEWNKWLCDRYETIENAEKTLGVELEKDIYGYAAIPNLMLVENCKVTAEVCEFVNASVDYYWSRMYSHLKTLLPNQMITFRYGGAYPKGRTQAGKYLDFGSLEIYDFNGFDTFDEEGCRDNCVGLCVAATEIYRFETDYEQPVVWAEYGRSACGIKWHNELFYDRKNMKYLEKEVNYQTLYNRYMEETVEETKCAGTAPWWWCGGFRYTELADFGYVMPDGSLTQSGKNYVAFCEKMKKKICEEDNRDVYVAEGRVYDYFEGKNDMLKEIGVRAYKESKKSNKRLIMKSKYDFN